MNLTLTLALSAAIPLALLGAALAFGGPAQPAPMASITSPFRGLDMSDLPAPSTYRARDGQALVYRRYDPVAAGDAGSKAAPRGSVTLVHGSSASSESLHPMARALAAAGWQVWALDMRGHGGSGTRGQIGHIGQLDEDLADFVAAVQPAAPATLAGFSSGGGFVLRIAGSPLQTLFQSYLLLSPFLGQDASTHRPDSGGWVKVGVPRLVAVSLLDRLGVRAFHHLPVTRFALDEAARSRLTETYSYALSSNFRPLPDHRATMRAVQRPCALLAGTADEAFHAERFADEVAQAGQRWPVRLLPGLGHIALTLDAGALQAIAETVSALQRPGAG